MQSRMDKYYKNSNTDTNTKKELRSVKAGRTQRNQELYKEVSHLELEDFDLNSNASVIGDNTNVNIDDIKDMLDKKYPESNKKHSIGDSTEEINLPKINLDETREYDINSILEKAKEKKEVRYEQDRLKKVHNTQYDILKSLDIFKENDDEDEEETSEELEVVKSEDVVTRKKQEKLLDLIDTITAKELVTDDDVGTSTLDPLDILSDLRGDDENTKVMGALEADKMLDEDDDSINHAKTLELDVEDSTKAISEEEINETEEVVDSNSNDEDETEDEFLKELEQQEVKVKKVKKKKNYVEFDDFSDLKDDMLITKILVRILVFIIIVVFIIACVLLANKYLGLGLF